MAAAVATTGGSRNRELLRPSTDKYVSRPHPRKTEEQPAKPVVAQPGWAALELGHELEFLQAPGPFTPFPPGLVKPRSNPKRRFECGVHDVGSIKGGRRNQLVLASMLIVDLLGGSVVFGFICQGDSSGSHRRMTSFCSRRRFLPSGVDITGVDLGGVAVWISPLFHFSTLVPIDACTPKNSADSRKALNSRVGLPEA